MMRSESSLQFDDPYVFISYAKEDHRQVRVLFEKLKSDDLNPWLDSHNLKPGHDWEAVITSVIQKCRYVLICLSKNSVSKTGYVQKEVRMALEIANRQPDGKIFVIPVRMEECEVPSALQKWQWVDLFRRGAYRKLAATLQADMPQPPKAVVSEQSLAPFAELRATLQDPFEVLLFDSILNQSNFSWGRLSSGRYAVSDGAFLEFRRNIPRAYMALDGRLLVNRRVKPSVLKRLIPPPATYRNIKCRCHSVLMPSDRKDWVTLLNAAKKPIAGLAPLYWSMVCLRVPRAEFFASSPIAPVIVESNGTVVALIAPYRMDPD